ERQAERFTQRGNVLEENLLLQILRARRDEHALAVQNGRNEIRERLAGARAGFREQHAALLEGVRDGSGHLDLAGARLERRQRARERTVGGEEGFDYSG